jgi:uncharacterized protein YndB with AHSA1/START domain/uncharacterized protein YbcV (DUF1398 family)
MAQHGYIVIADITGYTTFLSGSELEHAEDSLKDLLDVLIEQAKPPLVISRLEGDAVISYAPDASFLQGQTMVEIIENTYVEFREARQRMRLNTNCPCNACQNIPNLDLKFFVHHGTYVLQKMTSYMEMVGNDVNVAHRLPKNHIKEQTGISAYAAYTEAAVEALGIHEFVVEMQEHVEQIPDIGEIRLYVENLQPVWERESRRRRVFVEPEDAFFTIEMEIPAAPALVWDYLTKPEYRMYLTQSDTAKITGKNLGRIEEGSAYICAHGDRSVRHPVLDWRPFEYYTYEAPWPAGLTVITTMRLVPMDGGTHVMAIYGLRGPAISRIIVKSQRKRLQAESQKGLIALKEIIEQELNSGVAVRPEAAHVAPGQIAEAVKASLAEAGAD